MSYDNWLRESSGNVFFSEKMIFADFGLMELNTHKIHIFKKEDTF